MLDDLSPTAQATDCLLLLDKPGTLGQIEQLARLSHNWNGYGASPIDPEVIQAAIGLINQLPDDAVSTPQVVPMTRGRLQLEWHRGQRSLELEFETPTLIHYLKYDQNRAIEEEATLPADDTIRLMELLHWFHEE